VSSGAESTVEAGEKEKSIPLLPQTPSSKKMLYSPTTSCKPPLSQPGQTSPVLFTLTPVSTGPGFYPFS